MSKEENTQTPENTQEPKATETPNLENTQTPENTQEKPEKTPELSALEKAKADFQRDMHKYKSERDELKAELQKIRAEREAQERQTLEEKQEWEKLYKMEREQKEAEAKRAQEIMDKTVNNNKVNSVIQGLGGLKNLDYKFIVEQQVANIKTLEDGMTPDPESVQTIVDNIKQKYPDILKTSAAANLPSSEAPGGSEEKSYSDMTPEEQKEYYKKLVEEDIKQNGLKPSTKR